MIFYNLSLPCSVFQYNMSREAFFDNTLRVNYLRNLEKVMKFREPVDDDT